jgi:ketosteroid isomerase-like protein
VRNHRDTVKIEVSNEQDAAFAVVDIDTLWRHKTTRKDFHWQGRVCKIYTKLSTGEWKMMFQTGALNFPMAKSRLTARSIATRGRRRAR